ncbi:TerC family protein [Saprospiraceae bacterium]
MMDFLLFMDFTSVDAWMALLTLTFLEIVLGIDNIIFISIAANKLPEKEQPCARFIGLGLALVFRIIMLLGLSFLIGLKEPFWSFHSDFISVALNGQAVILFLGGIFLLYKSVAEIHHKLEGDPEDDKVKIKGAGSKLMNVIVQIAMIDMVFSIDSILTAVGLTKHVSIMIAAVIISIAIMLVFAGPVGRFINKHPTIQMLGLAFLLLIGFMLITESAHLSHFKLGDEEVGSIPKGYLYFAIAFSVMVEFLNSKLRKKPVPPVDLRSINEEAQNEGLLDKM